MHKIALCFMLTRRKHALKRAATNVTLFNTKFCLKKYDKI